MERFRVELIAATPNPQQCVYAAMHQDYCEGFVAADRSEWPDEVELVRFASSACWLVNRVTTDPLSTLRSSSMWAGFPIR